jgi:hypothetical protein
LAAVRDVAGDIHKLALLFAARAVFGRCLRFDEITTFLTLPFSHLSFLLSIFYSRKDAKNAKNDTKEVRCGTWDVSELKPYFTSFQSHIPSFARTLAFFASL